MLDSTDKKTERKCAPLYVSGLIFPEAVKTLVNNPQDRTGAAKAAIEANGGTMIGAWMAFGSDDLLVIADMPDDASMAGVAFAVSAAGAIVNGKTTKLLDMPTAVEGMTKAKAVLDAYRPPS